MLVWLSADLTVCWTQFCCWSLWWFVSDKNEHGIIINLVKIWYFIILLFLYYYYYHYYRFKVHKLFQILKNQEWRRHCGLEESARVCVSNTRLTHVAYVEWITLEPFSLGNMVFPDCEMAAIVVWCIEPDRISDFAPTGSEFKSCNVRYISYLMFIQPTITWAYNHSGPFWVLWVHMAWYKKLCLKNVLTRIEMFGSTFCTCLYLVVKHGQWRQSTWNR